MSSSRPSSIRNSKTPDVTHTSQSPRSPPIPHFDDPPQHDPPDQGPTFAEAQGENENEIPYLESGPEQTLLPPPNFNPFFTLIEDTTSGEHYHPYVHYVFADDDPVIVTAAAMRSLGLDETKYIPQNIPDREEEGDRRSQLGDDDQEQGSDQQVDSPLPPPIPGVKERYLLIDIAADGQSVVDAQSLSADWQITNAGVRYAPSFNEESSDQTYMLSVQGVEIPGKSKGKCKGAPGESRLKSAMEKAQGDAFAAMDGLVQGVESSLEVASKITGREHVGESEGTVLAVAASEETKES
jgi:hypothetical protein